MALATCLLETFARVTERLQMQLPFSSHTLWNVGWRYLLRHPWQSVLMIVGIMLGVAVVVSIDLANASATRAFDLSADAVAGRATHQITGGPGGLSESIYTQLRLHPPGTFAAAPVITEYVSSPQLGNRPLQLLGIDPFAEAPFRSYLSQGNTVPLAGLTAFLTQPGAVLISNDMAEQYGLVSGSHITLNVSGHERAAFVAGLLKPSNDLSRRALDSVILADISTAQELTGRLGKLDRIDLILPADDPAAVERIAATLPPSVHIEPATARTGALNQMTAAFRTNLTALSLLALVVGMFLIYNTMTFSVVQCRPLFGTLRCLGVTRTEVFALVVSEALIVGVIGSGLGLVLGIILSQGMVRLVTQTINDLYFAVTVRSVDIPTASLVKGVLAGVVATVATAALPGWEAASVPPRAALLRSSLETKARRAVMGVAVGGIALLILGILILALPSRNLDLAFGGTFAIVMGFAMLTPLGMEFLMRSASPLTGRAWGTLGRMAPRNVVVSLSRTSVAVAALMVAVSVTIGVSLMIGSFRYTVITWLAQTLRGDIYITAPSLTATQTSTVIDPSVVKAVQTWPGIARMDTLRNATVDSPNGPVRVAAVNNPDLGNERLFLWADGSPAAIWTAMQQDAMIVSEPFARQANLPRHGGTVTLYADDGPQTFRVIGVYYDYASSQGTVMMSSQVYRQHWHDDAVSAISLRLAPGANVTQMVRELQAALTPMQQVLVQPNRALRDEALVIFDRTFAITGALQLLATLVAFIGVLSALLSLLLEKQRELGLLRALGLTVREIWGLVMLETGLMGAVAGLLAMPTGLALSYILIYIINRRSFGWTLQMRVEPAPFVMALAIAVVAALLAGIYPARRLGRLMAAEALRFE
jgi:putative ABC transport system permease protein